ncbi:unnamed protein product [Schistocephalus solidus]|uniref:C2H2-type domain-containing protein n=1 Tax=Schistocephalus solidus TaxID=70667 RepID=A0A183ST40_SCHSO|nr:unnamed protein product [Schistocephalus solidus]
MLRQVRLRWSGHHVKMDDERLPKLLFYGDVATGARRQGGQKRRYNDTEEITEDRPAWGRSVKTGSAIYEANHIAAAKAKRAARNSPASRTNIIDAQALPKCSRCQRNFRARIDLVGHLRMQCTNNQTIPISTSNSANPTSDFPTLTPGINSITPTIIETTSQYSSPVTRTTATTTAFAFTTITTSNGDSLLTCPHCNRTFTSRNGLVGHLRIHRIQTGEPVPGAPTHSRDRRLNYPHCPRTFTHRMGLFGHMRIHNSGIHRNAENNDTSCTPSAPAILNAAASPTTMNDISQASTDFSCLHCARNINSGIGLISHVRIHGREDDEPVPEAPTYSRCARLHCP